MACSVRSCAAAEPRRRCLPRAATPALPTRGQELGPLGLSLGTRTAIAQHSDALPGQLSSKCLCCQCAVQPGRAQCKHCSKPLQRSGTRSALGTSYTMQRRLARTHMRLDGGAPQMGARRTVPILNPHLPTSPPTTIKKNKTTLKTKQPASTVPSAAGMAPTVCHGRCRRRWAGRALASGASPA